MWKAILDALDPPQNAQGLDLLPPQGLQGPVQDGQDVGGCSAVLVVEDNDRVGTHVNKLQHVPGEGLKVGGGDNVARLVLLPAPKVDQEHVVGVGDVGSAEAGVEDVEEGIGRDVPILQLLRQEADRFEVQIVQILARF